MLGYLIPLFLTLLLKCLSLPLQVSHHPPISAFYVCNRKDGFSISGSILAKSKFYGTQHTTICNLFDQCNQCTCNKSTATAQQSAHWLGCVSFKKRDNTRTMQVTPIENVIGCPSWYCIGLKWRLPLATLSRLNASPADPPRRNNVSSVSTVNSASC